MNLMFFVFALGMTVVALSFVATPLLAATRKQNSGSAKLSLLGAVAVFGLAIVLYGVVGRPDVADYNAPVHAATNNVPAMPTPREPGKAASVTDLLAGLEARLEESPNDGKGWLLLAQSYEHLGQVSEARSAYEKAVALGQSNAELEAKLVGSATSADPAAVSIQGRVSIAESVAAQVSPNDVVFIIAKTSNSPMPLAVQRRSAAELPFDFVMSDADSMVKNAGISTVPDVVVAAKISKSGDALNTAAGLEAVSGTIDPRTAESLDLVIGSSSTL